MLGLSIALSGALLIQSQTPAPTDDLTPAQVEQVVPLLMQTFETFGSCEQFFPPEVAQQFRAQLAAPKDADVATLMVLGLLEEALRAWPRVAGSRDPDQRRMLYRP